MFILNGAVRTCPSENDTGTSRGVQLSEISQPKQISNQITGKEIRPVPTRAVVSSRAITNYIDTTSSRLEPD
jgi:hypothetical protein